MTTRDLILAIYPDTATAAADLRISVPKLEKIIAKDRKPYSLLVKLRDRHKVNVAHVLWGIGEFKI